MMSLAGVQNPTAVLIHRSEQHRIVLGVTALHVALATVLLVSGLLQFRRLPKLEVVKVNLISLPPPTSERPALPPATPPITTPPEPTPPRQNPPQHVVAPPEPPKPQPPKRDRPKVRRTPTKEPAPVKPKPKKSDWVARKPEDILKGAKMPPPSRPAPPRRVASVNAADLERRLNAGVRGLRISAPTAQNSAATSTDISQYYAVVGAMLRTMWNQPMRSEVAGSPTVEVSLTVLANGHVAVARMDRSSPSPAMNVSVTRVLKRLTALPAPSDYGIRADKIPIQIVFELDG